MKSIQELWNEWCEKPCDWDMLGNPIPNKTALQDFIGYVYAGFTAAHSMLTASLPAAEDARDGLRPIETAPKDGTVIDLWVGGEFADRHADCYWGKPCHECGEMGRLCDSEWHDLEDGWVDGYTNDPLYEVPTHWRPLPAAPAMSQDSKGEV